MRKVVRFIIITIIRITGLSTSKKGRKIHYYCTSEKKNRKTKFVSMMNSAPVINNLFKGPIRLGHD